MSLLLMERQQATARELGKMFDAVSSSADGAPPAAAEEEDVLGQLPKLRKRYDA